MSDEPTQFDLDYRPPGYWGMLGDVAEVLARIPGTRRRTLAQGVLSTGGFSGLQGWLAKEQLTEEERTAWGRIHPAWMGGEYLPAINSEEVEIARVTIESTTGDVISIRARHDPAGIRYSIVDEYETDFELKFECSAQPLCTRELVELIDQSAPAGSGRDEIGLVFPILRVNYENTDDPATLRSFIGVSSSYYPDLDAFYDDRIDKWLATAQIVAYELDHAEFIAQFTKPELALLEADHGGLKSFELVRFLVQLDNHDVALHEVAKRFGRPDRAGYLQRVIEAVKREEEEEKQHWAAEREREQKEQEQRYAAAPIKSPDGFPAEMTVDALTEADRTSLSKWLRETLGFRRADIRHFDLRHKKDGREVTSLQVWTFWELGKRFGTEKASAPFPTVEAYFAALARHMEGQP